MKITSAAKSASSSTAWCCLICGYVHRGDELPETCPLCGAPKSEFEPYQEPTHNPSEKTTQWRCIICAHIHSGTQPPETCPLCGASTDAFEPFSDAPLQFAKNNATGHIIILGGGIAGVSAIQAIRQFNADIKISLLTSETNLPYYRLNLTRYLAGETNANDLTIHPRSWYDAQKVDLLTGTEAADLMPDASTLMLTNGKRMDYDKLIITAGAHPFVPPFASRQLEGVTTLRTIEDANQILQAARSGATCVVIGGGILGLETAGGIARCGGKVTLLESHEWLMPRQLNQKAAELMEAHLHKIGIKLRKHAATKELIGNKQVTGVKLKDGNTEPADLVIITTGIRPNSHLARKAGLEVGQGIIVNNLMQTSQHNIFAAGDIAEHRGILYGTWLAAQHQGTTAGMNALEKNMEFGGLPRANTLKVLGLDLVSIGTIEPQDGSYQIAEYEKNDRYTRLVFRDNRLVGAVLMGHVAAATALKRAIENQTDCSNLLQNQTDRKSVV